ncbi:Methionine--tRNA ligase [Candidatus Terasakiella magnetica]|uniref:Methionine--tRNA ligase n=1 Tax=Candidatus Terasakiella magnetica TaxID=1867952 RepID=A0A1C3RD23_9PROT|nr:methionine--tRNA ligase [Candidatus Terasakiella magnetica]SCA55183.1 Methionine--tRNA ligase [Candidatus Terasakiella magnetica]
MGATPFYITTPIYYVNDKPHIGHAYTSLACDVMARFKRLDGYDVKFLTGTDEHGQKVEKSATAKGVDPQTFTDGVSQNFRDLAEFMGFTNNDFIRTTEERHKKACQALWNTLIEKGDIYLGGYEGWYAVRDEAFYTEDELEKKPDGTRIAKASGAEVEWVEEPSYFFKLSAYEDKLLAYYEENADFILPKSRRNEVISFVKGGLQDLSVSRTTFKWGIPVPNDDDHIMYVWMDALTNYMTAAGYPDVECDEYKKYWPADVHMVGKDILRFHAVYWPAFLMAADLPLPKRVFAHGWWTNEGEKISKSLGNVIDPIDLVNKYGLDQVRYFMLREVPFGNDGDFAHSSMIARMNGELANDLGNLSQRVLSMVVKNCDGAVPTPGEFTAEDKQMLDQAYGLLANVREQIDVQSFNDAIETIWLAIRAANAYVDHQAPWKLKKEDPDRMATVLYVLAETIRNVALLLQPLMPTSMDKMLSLLEISENDRTFASCGEAGALKAGTALEKPEGVFPRFIDHEELENSYEGKDGKFFIKRGLRQNPKNKETVFEIIFEDGKTEELNSEDLAKAVKKGTLTKV